MWERKYLDGSDGGNEDYMNRQNRVGRWSKSYRGERKKRFHGPRLVLLAHSREARGLPPPTAGAPLAGDRGAFPARSSSSCRCDSSRRGGRRIEGRRPKTPAPSSWEVLKGILAGQAATVVMGSWPATPGMGGGRWKRNMGRGVPIAEVGDGLQRG
jgi:hypothetical protein